MYIIGDKVNLKAQADKSDKLIIFDIKGDECLLHRESTFNSCGWFKISELDEKDDEYEYED